MSPHAPAFFFGKHGMESPIAGVFILTKVLESQDRLAAHSPVFRAAVLHRDLVAVDQYLRHAARGFRK
jgi:hypothetical protein